jgi:diadenosine tetraphosphate (Ap4A) HIT family hydrolase
MSPYEGTTHHYIFVYKPSHITLPSELSPESRIELFDLIDWAVQEFNIPGGSFFMRFGNSDFNGSSVEHLHGHLISGTKKGDGSEGLKVKLSYKKIVT